MPGHLLQLLGVSGPLHRNLGSGLINVAEVVRSQFDGHCPKVFVQPVQLCSPRNRDNPRLLGEQPCESNLSRCCLFSFGDAAE